MPFHFGCISKRPNSVMDMCSHFILGSVSMIFYHPKWNFISVKMTRMKSIPALTFKRICTLNATSNESALIHFFWVNYVHMKISCRFEISFRSNWRYEIHTVLSFISPQFMWTQVKSWLNTEVRFSTEMKSQTSLSPFRLSHCVRTLKYCIYFP